MISGLIRAVDKFYSAGLRSRFSGEVDQRKVGFVCLGADDRSLGNPSDGAYQNQKI